MSYESIIKNDDERVYKDWYNSVETNDKVLHQEIENMLYKNKPNIFRWLIRKDPLFSVTNYCFNSGLITTNRYNFIQIMYEERCQFSQYLLIKMLQLYNESLNSLVKHIIIEDLIAYGNNEDLVSQLLKREMFEEIIYLWTKNKLEHHQMNNIIFKLISNHYYHKFIIRLLNESLKCKKIELQMNVIELVMKHRKTDDQFHDIFITILKSLSNKDIVLVYHSLMADKTPENLLTLLINNGITIPLKKMLLLSYKNCNKYAFQFVIDNHKEYLLPGLFLELIDQESEFARLSEEAVIKDDMLQILLKKGMKVGLNEVYESLKVKIDLKTFKEVIKASGIHLFSYDLLLLLLQKNRMYLFMWMIDSELIDQPHHPSVHICVDMCRNNVEWNMTASVAKSWWEKYMVFMRSEWTRRVTEEYLREMSQEVSRVLSEVMCKDVIGVLNGYF